MSWARLERERGGFGFRGSDHRDEITQLTQEERKSARQRHGRERERLGEMSYDEREGERERERL